MDIDYYCKYCDERDVKLVKLLKWDKPEEYDWYCVDHWYLVKNFEKNQRDRFISLYADEHRRKWLSKDGLKLWEYVNKA